MSAIIKETSERTAEYQQRGLLQMRAANGFVSGDIVEMVAPWFMQSKVGIVVDPACGEDGQHVQVFWPTTEAVEIVRPVDLLEVLDDEEILAAE